MIKSILLKLRFFLAGLVALAAVWFSGKRRGKVESARKAIKKKQKQDHQVKQVVNNVERETNSANDDALRDIARDKWLRK